MRFVWNLGAGSTPIEYPLEIESADSKADERDKWYRVVAERSVLLILLLTANKVSNLSYFVNCKGLEEDITSLLLSWTT